MASESCPFFACVLAPAKPPSWIGDSGQLCPLMRIPVSSWRAEIAPTMLAPTVSLSKISFFYVLARTRCGRCRL